MLPASASALSTCTGNNVRRHATARSAEPSPFSRLPPRPSGIMISGGFKIINPQRLRIRRLLRHPRVVAAEPPPSARISNRNQQRRKPRAGPRTWQPAQSADVMPVATAPNAVHHRRGVSSRCPLCLRQCTTIPACESVKAINTPIAYSGISRSVMPPKRIRINGRPEKPMRKSHTNAATAGRAEETRAADNYAWAIAFAPSRGKSWNAGFAASDTAVSTDAHRHVIKPSPAHHRERQDCDSTLWYPGLSGTVAPILVHAAQQRNPRQQNRPAAPQLSSAYVLRFFTPRIAKRQHPIRTASTPVIAVQPLANTFSSNHHDQQP